MDKALAREPSVYPQNAIVEIQKAVESAGACSPDNYPNYYLERSIALLLIKTNDLLAEILAELKLHR